MVIVGMGEMGGVFATAFLSAGHPVYPVLRDTSMSDLADLIPEPALVMVTVGEDDLDAVLGELPTAWKARVGLIQNELLPRDWTKREVEDPTVAAVWFEKKPAKPITVIVPTPVAGPNNDLVVDALAGIGIGATAIPGSGLVGALVAKNLYILTANIGGLRSGGTVSELWNDHGDLARSVADEVLDIQEYLAETVIDREEALAAMVTAIEADPDHGATGRSAPRRLQRAIGHARAAGLETPVLRAIADDSVKNASGHEST